MVNVFAFVVIVVVVVAVVVFVFVFVVVVVVGEVCFVFVVHPHREAQVTRNTLMKGGPGTSPFCCESPSTVWKVKGNVAEAAACPGGQ